jgi:hypothetical protein
LQNESVIDNHDIGGAADAEDTEDQQQWEDDWDTEAVDDEFSKQLRYLPLRSTSHLFEPLFRCNIFILVIILYLYKLFSLI